MQRIFLFICITLFILAACTGIAHGQDLNEVLVKGRITGIDGTPLTAAAIMVKRKKTGTSADNDGRYSIVVDKDAVLEISCMGYQPVDIKIKDSLIVNVQLEIKNIEQLQEVVITCGHARRRGCPGAWVTKPVSSKKVINIEPVAIVKLYPNPVNKGAAVDLLFSVKQPGNYLMKLCNAAGAIIWQRTIDADTKQQQQNIKVDKSWSGGLYYFFVLDKTNNTIVRKSFIVQ